MTESFEGSHIDRSRSGSKLEWQDRSEMVLMRRDRQKMTGVEYGVESWRRRMEMEIRAINGSSGLRRKKVT